MLIGDNGGCSSKNNKFISSNHVEAKDGYDIKVQASSKGSGEVGDVEVDGDFVDEDYRVRDDDDFF